MKKFKDYLGESDSALSDEEKERAMKRAMAHADEPERGEDRKKVSVAKAPWESVETNEADDEYSSNQHAQLEYIHHVLQECGDGNIDNAMIDQAIEFVEDIREQHFDADGFTKSESVGDDISELKKLSGIEEAMDADEDTVRELVLYADNDGQLYTQSTAPIQKNLSKKFTKGTYDHELAAKLWKYHADRAAKKYGKEHGNDDGFAMFSPADRRAAAQEFADNWLAELEAGNVHESAKPDFLDIDKDGDKEESMKKAAKDAESVDEAVAELRRLSGL